LTEEKARAQGFDLKIGRFPFVASGKSIAMANAMDWSSSSLMLKLINCLERILFMPKPQNSLANCSDKIDWHYGSSVD